MRFARVAVFISMLLLFPTAPSAQAGVIALPNGQITIDGATFDIPMEFDATEGGYIIGPFSVTTPTARVVNLDGFYDPDPQLDYGISIIDTGLPSTFSLTFNLPMVPAISVAQTVHASINGSMTDRVQNGVSITPLLPDLDGDGLPEVQVLEIGGPLINAGVDVGLAESFTPASATSTHTDVYGPYSQGPQAGPPGGSFNVMRVTSAFSVSGDGDAVALLGHAFAIPEPSSWMLACCNIGGLGALVLLAVRRRRVSA